MAIDAPHPVIGEIARDRQVNVGVVERVHEVSRVRRDVESIERGRNAQEQGPCQQQRPMAPRLAQASRRRLHHLVMGAGLPAGFEHEWVWAS